MSPFSGGQSLFSDTGMPKYLDAISPQRGSPMAAQANGLGFVVQQPE
jgi:hypothetical protein